MTTKRILEGGFMALLLFAAPLFAFAHAVPVEYIPSADSALPEPPGSISIRFSERVEDGASGIQIFSPTGERVEIGSAKTNPTDERLLSIPLQNAGLGSYTVSWQVVSQDDGHFTKGAYVLSAGEQATATAGAIETPPEVVVSSAAPEALAISLELLGEGILLALLVLLIFLWRPARRSMSAEERFLGDERFRRTSFVVLIIAGVASLLGALLYLFLKTSELAELRGITFQEAAPLFAATTTGFYTILRLILTALFTVIAFAALKRTIVSDKLTHTEIFLFVLLLVVMFGRARVSHAAASLILPNFSIFVNLLHLIGKNLWIGGVLVLGIFILPVWKEEWVKKIIPNLLPRFSRIVAVSIAVGGLSGCYIVWLHLKGFENLGTSQLGERFYYLLWSAAVLFSLQMYHTFALRRSVLQTANSLQSRFRLTWSAECLAALAVSFLSALIIITTPPLPGKPFIDLYAVSEGVRISLIEHDPTLALDSKNPHAAHMAGNQGGEEKKFIVTTKEASGGKEIPLQNITVVLTNEEKSIGPIVASTVYVSEGNYTFPTAELSPPGNWRVDITASREGSYDAVASYLFGYPISAEASAERKLHFGSFETILFIVALLILIFSCYLYRKNTKLLIQ